ncbi:transcription elongation factor GreA [Christensenella intestinihominis]|uniref:transcription elongation factor GreA n=1 Tax=Christensenella intestinihominis TaxID=1851429 RepID=UPI000835331F|nr:transcription elongation factor GreA [Christensenella intestinihominis]
MANEDVVLTHQGVKELEQKLEYLKTVRRLEIAEEIKTARAFGDLSENAEYDEAKNEQAKIEGEIVMLESMLRNATVVDQEDVDVQRVNVGTTVKVLDKEYDEEIEYKIVGSAEADLSTNKISNESPVGRALLGKKVGNLVKVETPGGIVKLKILDIHR